MDTIRRINMIYGAATLVLVLGIVLTIAGVRHGLTVLGAGAGALAAVIYAHVKK